MLTSSTAERQFSLHLRTSLILWALFSLHFWRFVIFIPDLDNFFTMIPLHLLTLQFSTTKTCRKTIYALNFQIDKMPCAASILKPVKHIAHFSSSCFMQLVWALTSFHFNVFISKGLICLASALYHLWPKMLFLIHCFWDNNHLQPFKYNIFIKVFQCILKSIETFLIQNYYYSNAKKDKKKKKKTDKFLSDNRFLNWKILNYFNEI